MRGSLDTASYGGRAMCYACMRPRSHCLCGLIKPFKAHFNLLILQHPHERRKYHSTARLLINSVTNATLLSGIIFPEHVLEKGLDGQQPYILFPGVNATDCESIYLDHSSTAIVIDGTWEEAGKILYRNPGLKRYPQITFKKPLRSKFYIRKQPKLHCLSTIESVAHLLKLNANASDKRIEQRPYDSLFEVFNRLVEQQLAYFPRMNSTTEISQSEDRYL